MFKAIWLSKEEGATRASVQELDESVLGMGEVDVDVEWSTLNYKDALAITGRSPVVRQFPLIPGIDLAGTVTASRLPSFAPGQAVILNGWGHGEMHHGGLSSKASVPANHLIPLPPSLTTRQAMAIGTAGYTAALCVLALESSGVTPDQGEILVTGANGGVGGFAIALLSHQGYKVVASTGRPEESDRLMKLGASRIISRDTLSAPGKPLQKETWAGVVDAVGSHTLANACAQTRYGGVVTACGLAQGIDFPATVAPFILRNVRLLGIDSVMTPVAARIRAWECLASRLTESVIEAMTTEIGLDDAVSAADELLAGKVKGRLLVRTR